MKTKINRIVFVILWISVTAVSYGQGFSNVGSASANFLKIPVEPVGAALGNSNVATNQGILGLYWNPGAIAYTEGTEILLSQVNWIADTHVSFLGATHSLGFGVIGLSITALTVGEMEITTETAPNGTGTFFNSGSYAFGLSYGMKIIDRFSFGGTVKYIYEYIWETHGSTLLFDLGSVYQTDFYNMRIGMRLANFGGNVKFAGDPIDNKSQVIAESGISYPYDPRLDRISPEYQLPQLFNVGISIDPIHMEDHRLSITAAVNDPNDNNTQLVFGSEYAWHDMLFLRMGYKSGYDEQNISAGLGVKVMVGNITPQIDFAYSAFGKLGSVLFLSMRLGL
ncbi:MAG: PorV/PorQ family protein [Ignavibacteriales bacterium]|nr:PorV/PorQ family protein [Ignavibacteriales bacterium]